MLEKLEKIRSLSSDQLGLQGFDVAPNPNMASLVDGFVDTDLLVDDEVMELIEEDDPIYQRLLLLIEDGFSGVILTGPPGTGKSRAARRIAARLSDADRSRLFFVQFHPAFQYEDFIEAYVPTVQGGFELKDKVFLLACEAAKKTDRPVVLVLDELSRTDVIRVFGEALTYIEPSKRGLQFMLASGREKVVPNNLIIIATMNPWDRGVEDLDLAFERRFAKISLEPDVAGLTSILHGSSLSEERKRRLERFFQILHRHPNPLCRLGHAYFQTVSDDASLKRLWENQLSFHFDRVLKRSPDELTSIRDAWANVLIEPHGEA